VLTVPDEQLDRFMATWEESNRRVAEVFLGDATGVLFEAGRKAKGTTTEQRLDPDRLDGYLDVLEIPQSQHAAIRRIAKREVRRRRAVSARAARRHFARRLAER